jgi:DNA-binding beta-propeller fold protein YncE
MPHSLSRFLNRESRCRLAALVVLPALIWGCGGRTQPAEEQPANRSIPVALILEKEIRGRVLGQSIKAPTGVTVDRRGTLFLVDGGSHRVIWFNADLVALRSIEGATSRSGLFDDPRAVTVDEDLNVWVTDAGNRRLVQYSEYLEFIDEIDLHDDNDPLRFGHPDGIAVSRFGEIYVTDSDNDRIAVLNTFGEIDRFVGDFGHPGGNLREPAGMTIDRHDHLYVCDAGNDRVMLYDDRGGIIREITHETLTEPCAAAIDRSGRVWVLDRLTALIHCFSTDGELVSTVGPMISGVVSALRRPSDMAFTTEGHLAISDTGNDRLLICRIMYDETPSEN